jgi:hypothetical protein
MSCCPVCKSPRILIVLGPKPSARCDRCGARWLQEGSEQRRIRRAPATVMTP